MKERLQKHLAWLKEEIESIEDELNDLLKDDEELAEKKTLLEGVPGVGPSTATALLAYLPELGSLNRKEIAKLVGLAPLNCDSGNWRGRRKIWGGRREVRKMLYMSALTGIKYNPVLKSFFERMRQGGKGKPFKVAMVACMRKLLVILNAIIRTKTPWEQK